MNTDDTIDTISRAMTEAERASIEAAQAAYLRGHIKQREVAPGIFTLMQVQE